MTILWSDFCDPWIFLVELIKKKNSWERKWPLSVLGYAILEFAWRNRLKKKASVRLIGLRADSLFRIRSIAMHGSEILPLTNKK